jgi:hypothetical protein
LVARDGPPPVEDRVPAIAKIIECDADDLLARAGRASRDITDTIKRPPVELAAPLRTTKNLKAVDIMQLAMTRKWRRRAGDG